MKGLDRARRGGWLRLALAAALGLCAALGAGRAGGQAQRTITVEEMRSERRVALVIGNAAYAGAPLRNPANDARAMAATLRALGFEVLAHVDLDERALRQAIDAFGDRLAGSGVGLFYYSGHGVQVGGRNYLVPVDARIRSEREVEYFALDMGKVLAKMDTARNRLNIVILDACRDNPFERSFRSGSRGLATIDAPTGTLIAYATSPGRTASDGEGANGLYTAELLRALGVSGLRLEDVFKRVGGAVRRQTNGTQVPWFASSVDGEFVFSLKSGGPVAAVPPPAQEEPVVIERPRVGSLVIRSPREGVEVWLGERRLGDARPGADLEVSGVRAGSYHIRARARREGFKPWEREVQVAANQRAEVLIDIEPLGPAKVVKGEDGAEMVLVPAGEFWMGSDDNLHGLSENLTGASPQKPRHRVYLDAFYIDKFEVTNALFERFVLATGHQTTAEREDWARVNGMSWRAPSGPGSSAESSHPVVQVSWYDGDAYCRWARKRLPTEAEWEKAARGTDGRRYPWGEQWDSNRAHAEYTKYKQRGTAAVGSYPSGASPYGAYDMAGNVREWVADWYDKDYYKRSPERNPTGPASGQHRVLRGGSWLSSPLDLQSAYRSPSRPDMLFGEKGFRCAKSAQ